MNKKALGFVTFYIGIILILALVAGLVGCGAQPAAALGGIIGETKEEVVMEVLQNDSEFLKVFGEEITGIEIEHTEDNISWVTVSGISTHFWLQIDLSTRKINSFDGIRSRNFTDEEKAIILQVLNTDARARSLLDGGAAIDYRLVSYRSSPFQHSALDKETTAAAWINLTLDPPQVFEINNVDLSEDFFSIWVDLVHKELSPFIYATYGGMTDGELAEIIDILRADYRTSTLLDIGSIIDMSKYENVEVNISKDVGALNPNPNEITDVERKTVQKLVLVYMQLEDRYYKADVDAVNRAISWFGEIEKP